MVKTKMNSYVGEHGFFFAFIIPCSVPPRIFNLFLKAEPGFLTFETFDLI